MRLSCISEEKSSFATEDDIRAAVVEVKVNNNKYQKIKNSEILQKCRNKIYIMFIKKASFYKKKLLKEAPHEKVANPSSGLVPLASKRKEVRFDKK